jgi:hypothetical protein
LDGAIAQIRSRRWARGLLWGRESSNRFQENDWILMAIGSIRMAGGSDVQANGTALPSHGGPARGAESEGDAGG